MDGMTLIPLVKLTREQIQAEIERRAARHHEFTFGQLHIGLPDAAYRMADAYLRKLKREGKATFVRRGRNCFWRMSRSQQDNSQA